MSHENHETPEVSNKKNKSTTYAAMAFVGVLIILVLGAANFIRIQEPNFQSIDYTKGIHTEHAEHDMSAPQPATHVHEHMAPAAEQSNADTTK